MANKWMTALKAWNEKYNKTGKWCVPKKGSKEYDEVVKVMGGGSFNEPKKGSSKKEVKEDKKQPKITEMMKKREEASKYAKKESAARRREARSVINPSKKGLKEAEKYFKELDKTKKTDVKKADVKKNDDYDLSKLLKKKKKTGVLL